MSQVMVLNVGDYRIWENLVPLVIIKHAAENLSKYNNVWVQRLCLQLIMTIKFNRVFDVLHITIGIVVELIPVEAVMLEEE